METQIIRIDNTAEFARLLPAADALAAGKLVAFPTETVYGLGGIVTNEDALLRIFAVKGRPADNPLIVHIESLDQLEQVVAGIGPKAERLMKKFWPGPLTLIFPKRAGLSPLVTAGLATVAVRMPSHPVARELLRLTRIPVAAPSANLSGQPSPTQAAHVIDDVAGKIEFIVDGGTCEAGVESTVLSLGSSRPLILRPGSVTREMISEVLSEPVEVADLADVDRPQAPGMKYRHYAPQAPVWLFEGPNEKVVAAIQQNLATKTPGQKTVIIGTTENIRSYQNEWVLDLGPRDHPEVAATRLYELLRLCDRLHADQIWVEGVAPHGVGLAVANRLRKAAGGHVIHVS